MKVNREDMIEMLAERAGYYKKDVRRLFYELDDVIEELFSQVSEDEDLIIYLTRGIKCGAKLVPERPRRDPRTNQPIICAPVVKPFARFTVDFREKMQNAYETKKNGEA